MFFRESFSSFAISSVILQLHLTEDVSILNEKFGKIYSYTLKLEENECHEIYIFWVSKYKLQQI